VDVARLVHAVTNASRYRPDATPDYSHRLHAGNVGDVWKHCALVELLRQVAATAQRIAYLETHAGEGRYPLGPTGEWTEGIGRLWATAGKGVDAVGRYVALCRQLDAGTTRPETYPGSPALARAALGPRAQLVLWERDEAAFATLAAAARGDERVRLERGDGLAALGDEIRRAEARADAVVVLVDPPWSQKADWTVVPDALARAVRGSARTCVMLWYPVKSLTRPNAMIARLGAAGIAGTLAELVTTPLEEKRHRLNGSGVLLVRPPAGVVEALGAAAPSLGARCATREGVWSYRVEAWSAGRGSEPSA
jgi:23S rRNA (adenine2030-N6)-methyltransferase